MVQIDSETPVRFVSESVVYTIDREHVAKVHAEYAFSNPMNSSLNLTLYLPFSFGVPADLFIVDYDRIIFYQEMVYDAYLAVLAPETGSEQIGDWFRFLSFAVFNLTFQPGEQKTLMVDYTLWYAVLIHDDGLSALDESSCVYLARTGVFWNHTLDRAKFVFRVDKRLYSYGFDGFETQSDGQYITAFKNFTNWTADQDIEARWSMVNQDRINSRLTGVFIILGIGIVAVLVPIVLLVRRRQRRLRRQPARGNGAAR